MGKINNSLVLGKQNIVDVCKKRDINSDANRTKNTRVKERWNSSTKQLITKFHNSTTFHGMRFAFGTDISVKRRVIWISLCVLSTCLLAVDIAERIQHFMSFPVSVNVQVQYRERMEFPAVTICNQNSFRRTLSTENDHYEILKALYDSKRDSSDGTDEFLESWTNVTMETLYVNNTHRPEDFIVMCKWKGENCNWSDFKPVMTHHGQCFSFLGNTSIDGGNIVDSPGVNSGLELVLNVEDYDSMVGPHSSSGVKVVLHKDTEVPMPEYGNELPTGRHGFMDVQVSKAQNVPLPHGSCVNKVLTYLDMYSYTVGACQMECEMQYVSAMCLCRPIHMPQGLSSLPSCNVVQYSKCLKEAKVKYRRYRDVKCSCPVPCSQTWFRPDLSYGALSRFSANQRRVLENLNLKSRLKNSRELAFREERDYVDLQHLYTHLNATSLPNFYRVLNDLESVDAMLNMSSNIIIHFYWHILYTRSYFDNSHKVYERYHDYSILLDKARLGFDLVEVTTLLDSQIRLMFLTDRPDKWRAYYEMMLSKTKTDLEAIRAVINSDFLTWFPNQYPNIWFDEDEVKTQRMPAVSTVAPDLQWTAIQNTIEESKKTINRYLSLAKSYMETGRMDKARLQTLNSTSIELAFDFMVQRSNMHAFYKDSVIGNLNHLSRVLTDRSEPIASVLSTFDKKCTTMYITKGIRKASSYLNMTVEYLSQYFNQERILQTIVHQFDSNEMKYFIEEVRTFASGTFHNKEFSMESEDCVLMLLDEYYKMLNVYIKIEPALAGLKHKFDHRYFNRIMPTPTQLQNFKFEKTEFLELVLVLDDIVKMMGDFKESLRMNQQFYRDNFLHLNVLFHELRYDELTQQIDYTIFALMGDIGGAMGLCIGASALSVFEIIDFLTVLVGTAMVKTNSNPRPKVVHVKPLNDSKVMTRGISKQEQISCTKELWMMERAKTFC